MSGHSVLDLHGVSETLLLPLYVRAVESRRPGAMIVDHRAAELVERIDYDWTRVRLHRSDQVATLMRTREFDRYARAFLAQHPAGTVVNIGCGLDTRFHRVDNGSVTWYDLDLPEVMALRCRLLDESPRNRFLACSALDSTWLETVRGGGSSCFFLAEGVLPYLRDSEVKGLLLALRQRFPGAEIVFDAMSPLLVRLHNLELRATGLQARLHWGLKRDEDVEAWAPGIRLLGRYSYFQEPEPRLGAFRLMRYLPGMMWAVRIVHYRLGPPPEPR